MPTLAECLKKQRKMSRGIKSYLSVQAEDVGGIKAVENYLKVVEGNLKVLGEAKKAGRSSRSQEAQRQPLASVSPMQPRQEPSLVAGRGQISSQDQAPPKPTKPVEEVKETGEPIIIKAEDLPTKFTRPGGGRPMTLGGNIRGQGIARGPVDFIKRLAREDPDFRANPVMRYVDGQMIIHDGATYKLNPRLFGLDVGTLTEGQEFSFDFIKPKPSAKTKPGERRGMVDPDLFFGKPVRAALKAGKWTAETTGQAARWVYGTLGPRASLKFVRGTLIGKFGKGIGKWVVKIFKAVKGFTKGLFGRSSSGATMASKPIPKATLGKLIKAINIAKPIRKEFELMKAAERKQRHAKMRKAQKGVGGMEALNLSLGIAKGEFERPSQQFEPIIDQFTEEEVNSMADHVWTHELAGAGQARMGIVKVLRAILEYGHLPTEGEILTIERLFGTKLARALAKKKYGLEGQIKKILLEVWNAPRAIITAIDVSAVHRQGFGVTNAHPELARRAFGEQIKAAGSEKYSQRLDQAMRQDGDYELSRIAKLELTPVSGELSGLNEREEVWTSHIIQRIPIIGFPFRASERAYITYLNQMRFNVFKQGVHKLSLDGKSPETHMPEYRDLAKLINASTGRANVTMGTLGHILNGLFFSPKLQISRFELPYRYLKSLNKPASRREAARQIVGTAAFITAVLGLLEGLKAVWDLDDDELFIESNPKSTKFGRVIIKKNTSIDLTGGMGSNIRLVTQMMTSSKKRDDGKIIKANPGITFWFWLRYKAHPSATAILNIMEGKRFGGKPVTPGGIAYDLMMPISIDQLWESVDEHGYWGLLLGIPESLGDSVQIKQDKPRATGKPKGRPKGRAKSRPKGRPK